MEPELPEAVHGLGSNDELVESVRKAAEGYLGSGMPSDSRAIAALLKVDRMDFVPRVFSCEWEPINTTDVSAIASALKKGIHSPYDNQVYPIGLDQNCSEPSMVAFMAHVLDLQEGMHVLEIGAGCGYSAAVLSHLVGKEGIVYTVECEKKLYELAERNLKKHFGDEYGRRVLALHGNARYVPTYKDDKGEQLLFDRICLTAGVTSRDAFPEAHFKNHLRHDGKHDGKILFPEQDGSLYLYSYERGERAGESSWGLVQFVELR